MLLPEIVLKNGEAHRLGGFPVGGIAAFDIWEGEYLGEEKCAIKVVRGIELSDDKISMVSTLLRFIHCSHCVLS